MLQVVNFQVKMTPPRDVFELTETLIDKDKEKWENDLDMDNLIKPYSWISAFLESPKMKHSPERTELFYFILHLKLLEKSDENNVAKLVIEMIRVRYFGDSDYWQPSVPLTDIHNVVPHIFSLLYGEDLNQVSLLKTKLMSLKQDQTVRDSLEPVYCEFLKNKNLHPTTVVQQCILSLL